MASLQSFPTTHKHIRVAKASSLSFMKRVGQLERVSTSNVQKEVEAQARIIV